MSLVPIGLALLNVFIYWVRRLFVRSHQEHGSLSAQHFWAFAFISYIVLPPVSMVQFRGLNCISLSPVTNSFLREDTVVSCDTHEYAIFLILNGLLIVVYQSVPIVWLVALYRVSADLCPPTVRSGSFDPERMKAFLDARQENPGLQHINFLWSDYTPRLYYFEVVDMYRRIIFISLLSLLGSSILKASIGCLLSLLFAIYIREQQPYVSMTTNVLSVVAQYQILLTFIVAVVLLSGALSTFYLSPFALGALLVLINGGVLALTAFWTSSRFKEERSKRAWRRKLTAPQLDIVINVMGENSPRPIDEGGVLSTTTPRRPMSKRSTHAVLEQVFVQAKDVDLSKRIGVGSFGEVFKGTCLGKTVAIKTILTVSEQSLRAFRQEILLTSICRHPNIINFVGACWGKELICLVLEWAEKGSLGGLLESREGKRLRWEDPLLRLATDISRGMTYLHGRKYFDERDGSLKECILHRDLKPDNVLITEFLAGKISDFGTSRSKSEGAATMVSAH